MSEERYSDNEPSRRDIPSFIEPRPPLIQNPFMRPRPQKGVNLLELFDEDSELEEPDLVQVYLRMKPCNEDNYLYEVRSDRCLVTSMDTTTMGHGRRTQHNVSKMYTFSQIFGPECSQKEVFESVVKENLKKLPEGQSFTLLTYGASGSGKTYTLMGTVGSPGLVPRALEYVFKLIDAAQQPVYRPAEGGGEKLSLSQQDYELLWVKKLRHVSAPLRDKYRRMSVHLNSDMAISNMDLSNRKRHYVWVSFVEIYNEAIYDLLSPPEKRTKLRIREDSSGNAYVKGATQAFVRTGEEAYDVMVAGKHNLMVAATGIHAQSSRSHCIFTITMLTETESAVRSSCVRLCDLAGCERARATRNTGARMQESRAINTSLHVLERCLHALRRAQKMRQRPTQKQEPMVPYRESKLTRLLGAGLSGARGEAVSMMVTLNPAMRYAQETKHVLSLAAVAQDIQINSIELASTFESSAQDTTMETSVEVMRLRADNERLHFELAQAQTRNQQLLASMESHKQDAFAMMRDMVEEAKDITRQFYEEQIQRLQNEMANMVEEYEAKLMNAEAQVVGKSTPSRFLQNKVSELMKEIAVLEEKLTAECLARSQAEKEVQYLRTCIDERDDGECEIHSDADPLNESLEPVFKVETQFNKTHLATTSYVQQSIDEDCEDTISNSSSDVVKDVSLDETPYTVSDDDSESRSNIEDKLDPQKGREKIVLANNEQNETTEIIHISLDVDGQKESIIDENNVSEAEKSLSTIKSCVAINENLKKLNLHRGTYCVVPDRELTDDSLDDKIKGNFKSSTDFGIGESKPESDNIETNIPKSEAEILLVNNIIKSEAKESLDDLSTQCKKVKAYYLASEKEVSRDTFDMKLEVSMNHDNDFNSDENKTKLNNIENKERDTEILVNKIVNAPKTKESIVDSSTEYDKTKAFCLASTKELPNDSFDIKTDENVDITTDFCIDKTWTKKNNFEYNIPGKNKEKIINKVMNSCQAQESIDDSLTQFEKLEIAARAYSDEYRRNVEVSDKIEGVIEKNKSDETTPNINADNISSKMELCSTVSGTQESKEIGEDSSRSLLDFRSCKEKRRYFDTIDINIQGNENKDAKKEIYNDILKKTPDHVHLITFDKLKANDNISKLKSTINKKESVDLFEGLDSPIILKSKDIVSTIEKVQRSTEKMVLDNNIAMKNSEVKLESLTCAKEDGIIPKVVVECPSNTTNANNTIEEFENIYRDITVPRATEFDLLVPEETTTQIKYEVTDIKEELKPLIKQIKFEDDSHTVTYNLRNKRKPNTKKSLHLRAKNQTEDESSTQEDTKLQDIVNLQQEYPDVSRNVSVLDKKSVLSSPENKTNEENLPPLLGIHTCPSKSVTRSRRKLFTPQAEPLEGSFTQSGENDERIRVPRPSYHRPRPKARRKL